MKKKTNKYLEKMETLVMKEVLCEPRGQVGDEVVKVSSKLYQLSLFCLLLKKEQKMVFSKRA